jgi:transcriptional regulator with AAA-type ATPase domain/transcriptional regulatory protein LevR
VHRKDRVFEALRSLCTQSSTQRGVARRLDGFSAEEVAELAAVDRTNASRDLNLLAQEGIIERIHGRPVLFRLKKIQEPTAGSALSSSQRSHLPPSSHPESASSNGRKPSTPSTTSATSESSSTKPADKPSVVAASIQVGAVATTFDTLIGHDEGLKVAIQQAKAAILYPPRGLHTLLCGPSGVGKTTLARLMHSFALELKALPEDAPFISFNCADYAGNPQLLMAHLFGVAKGAYTGADHDREGLVEQAHRGILFLDEVHRLPPEGQEMLFYLMDREHFRRLGENKERHASLLLLAATTEDPTTTLLPTFRRRIPMVITLPDLQERSSLERYELIRAFFTTECSSIGANIHVMPQVLRALLLYDCPGNIGQLRTDVQLICARSYLDYRTNGLSEMHVHQDMLPDHIRRGLLRTAEMHRRLEPVLPYLEAVHIFTPTGLSLNNAPESAHDLYDTISNELTILRRSGLREDEINKLLNQNIQHYFQRFASSITQNRTEAETGSHLVDEHILTLSHAIVEYAQEQLGRIFPEKLPLVLALHLSSTLEHLAQRQASADPILQSMRQTYPIEYEVARMALLRIRSALGVSLPENEVDVLTVLFANADVLLSTSSASVGIVVAAHGRGIANGLVELTNTLIGATSIAAEELLLDQSPEEVLERVSQRVRATNQGSGVLLLVDFASLLSLGDLVTKRTGIPVRTVSGVSAPLIIEAVRRAQRSEQTNLDQLATSLEQFHAIGGRSASAHTTTKQVDDASTTVTTSSFTTPSDPIHNDGQPQNRRVILSVCLTGFGSAIKLAEMLEEYLPELRQQGIEVICMDIQLSGKTEVEVQQLIGNRQVTAIVGTINPHLESYPFISLTDVLFGDGIARLRTLLGGTLIDPALLHPSTTTVQTTPTPSIFAQRADLIRAISSTLSQRLIFLNPTRVLPLIDKMIEMIEVEVGETFDNEVLSGLILHLACILERGIQQKGHLISEEVIRLIERQFARELSICRHALQILSTQVARLLPDEEAYNLVGILRQVDIFVNQDF